MRSLEGNCFGCLLGGGSIVGVWIELVCKRFLAQKWCVLSVIDIGAFLGSSLRSGELCLRRYHGTRSRFAASFCCLFTILSVGLTASILDFS